MLELKTKAKLGGEAHTLAGSLELVRYRNVTYVPADFETRDSSVVPPPERTIWLPLNREKVRRLAADMFDTLFATDSELSSFEFMVAQNARPVDHAATTLLVRTPAGLKQLNAFGLLEDPTGEFVPNALVPMLNENQADKDKVLATIVEWVDSEEEARALLRHLATSLAPGWSAVKYLLLLGGGRNGKSLLLTMLTSIFGIENCSSVTRQDIAEKSPTVTELNGKLLNVVFDGPAEYLKDSGFEKSLVAGEPVPIRKLYDSTPTMVQTTALFVEGLNEEPKSKDKSTALQKRLVRFEFPHTYADDKRFWREMTSERWVGALLSLLIDHYVVEDEISTKLAPTQKAIELQLEHMYVNSLGLQFLKYLEETDPMGAVGTLLGAPLTNLVQLFQSWRIKENDLGSWTEPSVQALFQPLINTERESYRNAEGKPRKRRVVTSLKIEAIAFLDSLKGHDDDVDNDSSDEADDAALLAAVVED